MLAFGCQNKEQKTDELQINLLTIDPGHFHAALVQKSMYKEISPLVHVYAPEGPEVEAHLRLIEKYNTRAEDPTAWQENVYKGQDYLQKMLDEKKVIWSLLQVTIKRKQSISKNLLVLELMYWLINQW